MFNSFGSIGQYRNTIRELTDLVQFTGMVDDKPTFNKDAKMPTVTVLATEKIHGTNAAVGMDKDGNIFVQSRKNLITVEQDNAGCAAFVLQHKDVWKHIMLDLALRQPIDYIYVYFEFCGGNIQQKTAVTGLDKRAIIFSHYKVVFEDETTWHSTRHVDAPYANIYNVKNFKKWEFEINFENPLLFQNYMLDLVTEVETNSPIGQAMGKDGNIGEGIVCTFEYKDRVFRFKVKGEKHTNTKVRKLRPVNVALEQKKIDFVNHAVTSLRLEQALDEVCGLAEDRVEPTIEMTGAFLRAVHKDIIKEESDILVKKGLCAKDVNAMISKQARIWYMKEIINE